MDRRSGGRLLAQKLLVCSAALFLVAGAPLHVLGSEAAAEEMPVIGGQADAAKDSMYMPPPEPEDEQGGHDGEDDEGDEEYIPHPDDEDALLKRAFEGEDGFNSTLSSDDEDDGSEEGYHPSYERDEDAEGFEGQDESDGMEAILQSEKAYFIARDHDGDGELSKEEFIRQLKHPDNEEEYGASSWDTWNVSDRGRPAPSDDELMWGKDWTARVSSEQAEEAFGEYDVDKDGKVSWAEWQGIMFHEDLQVPEYRDGHELDDVVDPLGDDDIDPEELELIKTRFVKADQDKDGSLSLDEVVRLIVWSHDEPDYPDGVMNYTRPSDVEIREAAAQLLKDYDRDRSQMLSLEEWTQGGGF